MYFFIVKNNFYIYIYKMIWLLLFILFCFIIILILFLFHVHKNTSPQQNKDMYYTSNTDINDYYVKTWNDTLFIPNMYPKNYMICYHYRKYKYNEKMFNITLDGEPANIMEWETDFVITTKKKRISKNIPSIYAPYFVWIFNEYKEKILPTDLIKYKHEKRNEKINFCCFLYSNCDEKKFKGVKNRHTFFQLMIKMTGLKVDSLGKCLNNKKKVSGNWKSTVDIYKSYKFVIAFENEEIEGYISEKLVLPMIARAIPIYLGAPDVSQYFNPKSFINVSDFPDFETCIQYILYIDENDDVYQSIMKEPFLINNTIDRDLFSLYYGGSFYKQLYNTLSDQTLKQYIRPCQFYSQNIRFISFADGKIYKNDRIFKEAFHSRFFKECFVYGPNDFDDEFKKKHLKFIQKNKRGYGYWIWKPYIILKNLNELNENDILIYADSGCSIHINEYKEMKYFYTLLEKYSILLHTLEEYKHLEREWTKMDCLEYILKEKKEIILKKYPYQYEANRLYLKKNKKTVDLIERWYTIMQNYHLIDDSPNDIFENDKNFQEHQHDQSIFSLLVKLSDEKDENIIPSSHKLIHASRLKN